MKNWKQLLAGFSTVALLLTNVGVSTPLAVYADEKGPKLSSQTLSDGDVTVNGEFPEDAKLTAKSVSDAKVGDDQDLIAAYELEVTYEIEKAVETEESDEDGENEGKTELVTETFTLADDASVVVTVKGLTDDEIVTVYQGGSAVKSDVTVADGEVSFTTSSLATVAVGKDKEITTPQEENTPKPVDGTVPTVASITLTDNIKEDGTLVATFKDSAGEDITDAVVAAAKDSKLTIVWSDGNHTDGKHRDGAISSETPNKINIVKDQGSQAKYSVSVGDVSSSELLVDYYTEVQNGGFEDPQIEDATNWTHQGSHYAFVGDQYVTGWNTTATDHMIEFGEYKGDAHKIKNQYPSDDTTDSKGNHTYGTQYAELNANMFSTLYQDVLTDGGSDLNWSLLHHCLPQDGTDTMYVVVMSTKEAEMLLAESSSNEFLKDTVGPYVLEHGTKDSKGAYKAEYQLTQSSKKVTITLWTASTSKDDGWKRYEGAYKVPSGQYLTRLFFVSASGNDAGGNLLEDVSFDQKVSYTIEYWVYNDTAKKYELKSSDTKTGRQYPGDKVEADTSKYNNGYMFIGSTQGGKSGGANPTITAKDIEFTVSGDNNVMSLYYKEAAAGTITWDDKGAPDGTRPTDPEKVKITTVVDGKTYTATVTKDGDDWSYSFNDLPKYDDEGKEISYDITTTVDGYTTSVDKETGNITYTYNPNVTGQIEWVDGNGEDRPTDPKDVKITTVVDGKTYTATVTKNGENWSYEFKDLPKNDKDGKPITYNITTTVDGYTTDIDKDGKITYTKTTEVAGGFTWDDNNDKYGVRPDTVEVQLLDEDGNPVTDENGKAITVTAKPDANGNYTYSFDGVPEYDADGNKIDYTVKAIVPGYDIETKANKDGGFDFVCSFDKDTYKNEFPAEDPYMWVIADPPVKKVIKGDTPSGESTFTFELAPESNTAGMELDAMPLPTSLKGEANHTLVTIKGQGSEEFGNFRFDKAGTYVYKVTEKDGHENGYTYDKTEYVITFKVAYDATTGWSCERTILKNGKGDNLQICTFTNTYKQPSSGKGGDKHDGGGYAKVDFYLVDDATTKSLTGGVYGLYTSAGELVGTYTTDANGHIQFPNLKGGTYYLQELTSPDGYALNGNKIYFTVDGTPIAVMDTNQALTAAGTTAVADTNAAAAAGVTGTDAASGNGTGIGAENGAAVGGATGDDSLMTVYAATAAMAAVVLAAWFAMTRKHANR